MGTQLSESRIRALEDYMENQETEEQKIAFNRIKTHLKSALAVEMSAHHKLLYIYNQFLMLQETAGRHNERKEQILFPIIARIAETGSLENEQVALADSFFREFNTENRKMNELVDRITEAMRTHDIAPEMPPSLKEGFAELGKMNQQIKEIIETETRLFFNLFSKNPMI